MRKPEPLIPLTHHEMLANAATITRRGRNVDLPACDRAGRLIAFKAVSSHESGLEMRLVLDLSDPRGPALTQFVHHPSGREARLEVVGGAIDALVDAAFAQPVDRHFRESAGSVLADSYRIDLRRAPTPRLIGCAAKVRNLELEMDASSLYGVPVDLRIRPEPETIPPSLPDDVLAILGRAWQPLIKVRQGWKTSLKLPKGDPRRTRAALDGFARMVAQLETTLSRSPTAYHARHRRARWLTFVRRSQIFLVSFAVIAALPVIDATLLSDGRELHPFFQMLPPILLGGAILFWAWDMPRFEIPPRPRPLGLDAWTTDEPETNP